MNGFRITILTLLCLSLALMFYAVFFVVPSWQGEYSAYQASQRISNFDRKSDFHRQQMTSYDPALESPEVEKARLAVEAAAKQNDQAVMEAEEIAVLAAAKRREEAQRAREEQEAAARAAAESIPQLGQVASYDPAWQSVMIKPAADHPEAYTRGATLAVFRSGNFLAEVVVDSLDVESGQVSATLRIPQGMPGVNEDGSIAPEREPKPGDVISQSPFPSADDLRAEVGASLLDEAPATEEAVPAINEQLPSLDEAPTGDEAPVFPAAETTPQAPEPVQPPSEDVRRALDSLPSIQPVIAPASGNTLPAVDSLLQPTQH